MSNINIMSHTHAHTHLWPSGLCPGLPGWAGTRKVKPIWIYWSKRQSVAVASAGPYTNMHLAPDRQPCQHTTIHFFTSWMPFLLPNQQHQSTEGIVVVTIFTAHIHGGAKQWVTCHCKMCTVFFRWWKPFLTSNQLLLLLLLLLQLFYGSLDFVWNYLGDLVSEESITHSHLSWSSIIRFLHLLQSMASSLFNLCLTVLLYI